MTARQILLRHLADLSDEDVHALLPIVERLRTTHTVATTTGTPRQAAHEAPSRRRHPERFGPLAGSIRSMGDVESPVAQAGDWTLDEENLKP